MISRYVLPGDAIADAGTLVGAERYLQQPEGSIAELETRPVSLIRIPTEGHPSCDPKLVEELLNSCAPVFVVDGIWSCPQKTGQDQVSV
ncbi:hypothetical protein [Ensifer sp. R-19]|uniref:hypothetical protein n=1 Tax=Ensifer sp. R-19 TaxID=3404055 RepID=UPI003CF0D67D